MQSRVVVDDVVDVVVAEVEIVVVERTELEILAFVVVLNTEVRECVVVLGIAVVGH